MFKLLLVAVIAVTWSLGEATHQSKCLPPLGKMNFDETKFSGEWFVVGSISTNIPMKSNTQCSKLTYSVKEIGNATHINMDVHKIIDGKEMKYQLTGQPIMHYTKAVLHAAWKNAADERMKGVMMQSILATDYTNFAIFYACQPIYVESDDMFSKMETVHIWSRKQDMEPKLMEVLKNIIGGFDFKVEDMKLADNSKC